MTNLSELAKTYTQEHSTELLGLHAFIECDSTSAFKGIGKKKPIKIQKNPKIVKVLESLGE